MPTVRALTVVVLSVLAAAPAQAEEDRAARVLRALQEAVHAKPGESFNSKEALETSLEQRRIAEVGRRLWVPVLPPHCGFGMEYRGLDVSAATRLARELFRAYGYDAVTGHAIDVGGRRLPLDLLDPDQEIGFLVVPAPVGGAVAPVLPWGDAARARLRARGLRVLVLPAQLYRGMQSDSLTSLLACALSVVDFLNDRTDGANVDVEAIATGRSVEIPLPALEARDLPNTSSPGRPGGGVFFFADGRGTVTLSFKPPKKKSRGIGLVVLPFWWTPPPTGAGIDFSVPGPRFLLQQGDVRIESERPVFVTPPEFDAGKPFCIRVDYVEGQVHLLGPVVLRVP